MFLSIIAVVFLITLVVVAITISYDKDKEEIYSDFYNNYNLKDQQLLYATSIKKLKKCPQSSNHFDLEFPHWEYVNKDGSKDEFRQNGIICESSTLYIDQYVVTTSDPFSMVKLVNEIRELNPSVQIDMCEQERKKVDGLIPRKPDSTKGINDFKLEYDDVLYFSDKGPEIEQFLLAPRNNFHNN